MHRALCIFRIIALILLPGIAAVAADARSADATHPVWVMSNGFHSAFVVRKTDAGPLLRSAFRDSTASWVVVGWGDRDFFMGRGPAVCTALKAVLWPTESALHVVPLRQPPEAVYRKSDIIRLTLSSRAVAQLRDYLETQFATDRQGRPIVLGRGFSERGLFFRGSEKFYFPKMCNWWVADGLRKAGIPLSHLRSITAHELMRQLKPHGVRTGARRLPGDSF